MLASSPNGNDASWSIFLLAGSSYVFGHSSATLTMQGTQPTKVKTEVAFVGHLITLEPWRLSPQPVKSGSVAAG